mgnify:CR=1 FL=1
MNRFTLASALALAGSLLSAPAEAKYTVVTHGGPALAAGGITVNPAEDWNRDSRKPIKKGEVWTLDGPSLNALYFVSGLAAGETLYRDADKKNRPLPKMNGSMLLTDIPEFFESSARVALNTSLFEVSNVAPVKLGGHDAVRFSYRYAVQGSSLIRNGVAQGTLIKGQLYLIDFAAPSLFYYERDAPKAEAIMASARL